MKITLNSLQFDGRDRVRDKNRLKIIKNKALNAKIKEVFRENLPESAYYLGVIG